MSWIWVSITLFILFSGLMATVEAAILSVTRPEIDELQRTGKPGAHQLLVIKEKLARSLAVLVIITNLINVAGPIVVSQLAVQSLGPESLVPLTLLLAVGTIVFSEVIPKSLGAHYAPTTARLAAPAIRILGAFLYPLTASLAWLSNTLIRRPRAIGTEAQIRSMVRLGRKAGHIEANESHMIFRTFHLNDRSARDIMTPLAETIVIPASSTVGEAERIIRTCEFSRFPVVGDSTDDVQGVVLARDVLELLIENESSGSLSAITSPALEVAADSRADVLLIQFRTQHQHLAIVRETGRFVGIVTLEDVLEEIVGEIEDERDTMFKQGV